MKNLNLFIKSIKAFLEQIELSFRLLKYYPRHQKALKSLGFPLKIKGINETLEHLKKNKCSISRFGDGEINIMRGKENDYCKFSPFLKDKLFEVWRSQNSNHIVGIPNSFIETNNLRLHPKVFWISYFCKNIDWIKENLSSDKIYYSAEFTRFYLNFKDKKVCDRYLANNKQLWDKEKLLIVEGKYSRLGLGNDLFSNAASIERVLCPEKNAYLKYDEILQAARKLAEGKLILLALGQTATGLAYDLAKEGFWAVDIGHIDIEYEWYLAKSKEKEKIEGKHVNEAGYTPENIVVKNERYNQEVVKTIF